MKKDFEVKNDFPSLFGDINGYWNEIRYGKLVTMAKEKFEENPVGFYTPLEARIEPIKVLGDMLWLYRDQFFDYSGSGSLSDEDCKSNIKHYYFILFACRAYLSQVRPGGIRLIERILNPLPAKLSENIRDNLSDLMSVYPEMEKAMQEYFRNEISDLFERGVTVDEIEKRVKDLENLFGTKLSNGLQNQ